MEYFAVLAIFTFLLFGSAAAMAEPATRPSEPVRVIFDSDMDGDCDDVAALALLHVLADRGEATVLATIACGRNAWTPACMSAINTYYGRGDVPVGRAAPGAVDRPSKYTQAVADHCPHKLQKADDAEDAVALYRRVLAAQPDQSVVIATVGFHTNLAALLKSPAAGDQPAGVDLIRQKVRLWACMGGNFIGHPAKDDLKLGNVNFQKTPCQLLRNRPLAGADRVRWARSRFSTKWRADRRALQQAPRGSSGSHRVRSVFRRPIKRPPHRRPRHDSVCRPRVGDLWSLEDKGYMDLQPDMQFQWKYDADRNQAYLLKRKIDGHLNDRAVEKTVEDLILSPATIKTK